MAMSSSSRGEAGELPPSPTTPLESVRPVYFFTAVRSLRMRSDSSPGAVSEMSLAKHTSTSSLAIVGTAAAPETL